MYECVIANFDHVPDVVGFVAFVGGTDRIIGILHLPRVLMLTDKHSAPSRSVDDDDAKHTNLDGRHRQDCISLRRAVLA